MMMMMTPNGEDDGNNVDDDGNTWLNVQTGLQQGAQDWPGKQSAYLQVCH